MKKKKKRIHKDKNGFEYLKESYFVGGKMKFRKVYIIEGVPAEEFYQNNATDIDHFKNGEYWLISTEKDFFEDDVESGEQNPDLPNDETEDIPF